jgi:hypothetical protein
MLEIRLRNGEKQKHIPEIAGITFDRPLEAKGHRPGSFDRVDHEAIAKDIADAGYTVASVVVVCQDLRQELRDNPKYMHITNDIGISQVQFEARKRLMNKPMGQEEVQGLIAKFELPTWKKNYGEDRDEADGQFKTQLLDAIFEAQEQIGIFEIMEELKRECRWDYDEETDEERERSEEEAQREWEQIRLEQVMPQVLTEFERVYRLPEPFCFWDPRNRFQQWYFVQKPDVVEYYQGGSGSSQQRETQGRYAHTFATLSRRFGKKIPTTVLRYTGENKLQLVKEYSTFRAIGEELTGNYKADARDKEKLFEGMLLTLNYRTTEVTERPHD